MAKLVRVPSPRIESSTQREARVRRGGKLTFYATRHTLGCVTPSKPLAGRTMFISGASRGIGLAIAKRFAADGGNVCLMAKTDAPDPRLEGTVHTAVAAIEKAGGNALGF